MIQIKILKEMPPHYYMGQIVKVASDEEGTPLDFFWQRRLNDAKRDSCCEIVVSPAPKIKKKKQIAFNNNENGSNE